VTLEERDVVEALVERDAKVTAGMEGLFTSMRSPSKFTPMGDESLRRNAQNGMTPFVESGIAQGVAAATSRATMRA
jgi:hypothetical protein